MDDYYDSHIVDDDDSSIDGDGVGDGDGDGDGLLDTQWIHEYENKILFSEYHLFLKSDITRVSFRFIYLDRNKECIQFIHPLAESYTLQCANQITQSEIFQIIYRHQKNNKKYYNFHSLLLYDFQLGDDNVSVAKYLSEETAADEEFGRMIEYTNILSIDTIYFQPLIAMFQDLIGFTVVLYED
jgi:hypothetical protein